MAEFRFEFEWDFHKAEANRAKHGVDFPQAAEVYRDPLAITIADDEHSGDEPRWIALGEDWSGRYVPVVHTFEESNEASARIRLISARRPMPSELRAYEKHDET